MIQQQSLNQTLATTPATRASTVTAPQTDGKQRLRSFALSYALVLPALVILGLFHIFPIFYGFFISLHKWGVKDFGYIGLSNYQQVFRDEEFWNSLKVTAWFVVGTVPIGIIIALFLAIMLFRPIAGRTFYRVVLFLPYITPPIAIAKVWAWMYQQDRGFMNTFVGWFGIGPQRWLLDPRGLFQVVGSAFGLALPGFLHGPQMPLFSVMVYSVWAAVGFDTVVFLAGLSNVPNEVVEAAQIDGANQWQIATQIIAPLLKPTIVFISIISTLRAFQSFNAVYALLGDPPPEGGKVITYLIFSEFFKQINRVGYGAATAMVLFVILFVITLLQLRLTEERKDDTERSTRKRTARGTRGMLHGS